MKYSPSPFEALAKPIRTIDNLLMINLQAVKDIYQKREVNDISFIRSTHNIAATVTNSSHILQCYTLYR